MLLRLNFVTQNIFIFNSGMEYFWQFLFKYIFFNLALSPDVY